jgi:hypothetical protein
MEIKRLLLHPLIKLLCYCGITSSPIRITFVERYEDGGTLVRLKHKGMIQDSRMYINDALEFVVKWEP